MKLYLLIIICFQIGQAPRAMACGELEFNQSLSRAMRAEHKPTLPAELPSGVRKQKLSAYYARDEFNITTNYDMLPQLKMQKLEEVTKFTPTSGTNENWFYRAKYNEKPVFIKTLDNEIDRFSEGLMLNEARHYYLLDMLGLGPKFHGVAKINGKMGVVLEHVEGVVVKWGNNPVLRQQGIKIHPSAIRDIKLAGSRLDQAGIHNPGDMQFIISPDGRKATLIDPEHFKAVGPDNGAKQSADAVIESLKGYFAD